jgi:hypothetical protein
LRADRQALAWHESGGLGHAAPELAGALELRPLAAHEPQHDDAVVGNVPQRLEGARSLVVELDEELRRLFDNRIEMVGAAWVAGAPTRTWRASSGRSNV